MEKRKHGLRTMPGGQYLHVTGGVRESCSVAVVHITAVPYLFCSQEKGEKVAACSAGSDVINQILVKSRTGTVSSSHPNDALQA